MDAAERTLLSETIGGMLAGAGPNADAALAELGWLEMLDAEPVDAVDIVFTALGTTGATSTALDDVLAAALGVAPRPDLAVLLPQYGAWAAPGRIDDGRVHAVGLGSLRAPAARELLVVCDTGAGRVRRRRFPVRSAEVRRGARASIPTRGSTPCGSMSPATRAHRSTPTPTPGTRPSACGQRATAHQIAGASRTMLTLACAHALERVQFGRRIASFQAVRHRLAEALVAVEALEATLAAAADEPSPLTAALAKATAGRTARTVGVELPAGARRDRLHHRPPVPPLPQADDGARRALRIGRRASRSTSAANCSPPVASRR